MALGIYAYFLLLVAKGGHAFWTTFRIPIIDPPFADMLNLTTAWGMRPGRARPTAPQLLRPAERPANYPRLWLALSPLGLGRSATTAWA